MADQVSGGQLTDRRGNHVLAVAQHASPLAQVEDLLQAMADEEHAQPSIAQRADDRKEAFDLVQRQRRRRFVHDQNARVERQRLGNLHQLLVGHRQTANG